MQGSISREVITTVRICNMVKVILKRILNILSKHVNMSEYKGAECIIFEGVTFYCTVSFYSILLHYVGPRGAVDSASDSRAKGPGFYTRSGPYFRFSFR